MFNSWDTLLIFAILSVFHLWGGAAIGAGIRGRRVLPAVWGALIGASPLYFGIERAAVLGSWSALAWQVAVLAAGGLTVGFGLSRVRAFFLRKGMTSLMIGTLIMAVGAALGAWLVRSGFEIGSLVVGGIGFLFGSMWFGAGIKQLRGK